MRETSAEVFRQIEEEGLLSKLRFVVYRALYEHGPMTAQETWHYLRDEAARRGDARINGITPRFSELLRLGVIKEVGVKPCKITGRDCIIWDVTAHLPRKLEDEPAKPSKTFMLKRLSDQIEEICDHMDKQTLPEYWKGWVETSRALTRQSKIWTRK